MKILEILIGTFSVYLGIDILFLKQRFMFALTGVLMKRRNAIIEGSIAILYGTLILASIYILYYGSNK